MAQLGETAAAAVSLDAAMAPMRDAKHQARRDATKASASKQTRGPAGDREAGRATLTFYDGDGERLHLRGVQECPRPRLPHFRRQRDTSLPRTRAFDANEAELLLCAIAYDITNALRDLAALALLRARKTNKGPAETRDRWRSQKATRTAPACSGNSGKSSFKMATDRSPA